MKRQTEGMTVWACVSFTQTNCAHRELQVSMGISLSEASHGIILDICLHFDRFGLIEERAMAVQYTNIKINVSRTKCVLHCISCNLYLNNME